MPRRELAGLVLLLLVLVPGCYDPRTTPAPVRLLAAGSTAMAPLMADLANAFESQMPVLSVAVSGIGTGSGMEALKEGKADFAMASWLPPGLSKEWQAVPIARDGIAVIVHPGNPLEGLGLLQLQGMFSGAVDTWGAVGAWRAEDLVQPVIREQGSGTRSAFEALVMNGQSVTPRAVVAPSSMAVVDYVASHPEAIGYVPMNSASARVRTIQVEGVLPGPQTTSDGTYPVTRELWLVYRSRPTQIVADLVSFTLSAEGQQIVAHKYGAIR